MTLAFFMYRSAKRYLQFEIIIKLYFKFIIINL